MSASRWSSAKLRKLLWGAAVFVVLMLTVPHFMATSSGIYKVAVTTAHQSPQFKQVLGLPVSEAWFTEGSWQLGNTGRGEILIPVQGRMRRGNLRARAIKDDGRWRLTELTLELTQPDEHIDLLSKAPI
ncbi:MAG: cytochrome c oxidase assembly factor Coa1 family protein [Candidatus Sulfotelmatobacter sp.]|jgi:cytochrome oxidase complex assembly protein 1